MRVLLIGHDFLPYRTSGDKNYWLGLVPHLGALDWLGVVSVNHDPEPETMIESEGVPIFNIAPVYAMTRFRPDRSRHGHKCAGDFKRTPAAIVDAPATILRHLGRLRRIIEDNRVDVVHFMDNFGVAGALLRRVLSSRNVAVSMTYLGMYKTSDLRLKYLRTCSRSLDGVVVANPAMADRLGGSRTRVVQWAAPSIERETSERNYYEARSRLGLLDNERLVLWTGYIQQLRQPEFELALRAAQDDAESAERSRFVFLVKPECWGEVHERAGTSEAVSVRSSSPEDFALHLDAADVLLSPVATTETIVTPPLTWIEAMKRGTSIVTTNVPGAADALAPTLRPLLSPIEGFSSALLATLDGQLPSRREVATWANSAYDLRTSAQEYVTMWQDMLENQATEDR